MPLILCIYPSPHLSRSVFKQIRNFHSPTLVAIQIKCPVCPIIYAHLVRKLVEFIPFQSVYLYYVNYKQIHTGFELDTQYPFPTKININSSALPMYSYAYVYTVSMDILIKYIKEKLVLFQRFVFISSLIHSQIFYLIQNNICTSTHKQTYTPFTLLYTHTYTHARTHAYTHTHTNHIPHTLTKIEIHIEWQLFSFVQIVSILYIFVFVSLFIAFFLWLQSVYIYIYIWRERERERERERVNEKEKER